MRVVMPPSARLHAADRNSPSATRSPVKSGRGVALRDFDVIEIAESHARETERRRIEESIALANVIPDGAAVVILDARGEHLDSASLTARLRAWRDADRDAVFVIGGPTALLRALRQGATELASARHAGRTSSCASCCSSSSIAP